MAFARCANLHPCNTCFLVPTRLHNTNGISIGSAIFAQHHSSPQTVVGHARACPPPRKLRLGNGQSGSLSNTRFNLANPSPNLKRHIDRFSRSWATVCKTVRLMLSDHCLSDLSVTFVYCGQTVGRIKMKLGTHIVLIGIGHIVLDGDSAPPPPKGGGAPNFGPVSVVAKWLHGSRCHLVRR